MMNETKPVDVLPETRALIEAVRGRLAELRVLHAKIAELEPLLEAHPRETMRDMAHPYLTLATVRAWSTIEALERAITDIEQAEAWRREGRDE